MVCALLSCRGAAADDVVSLEDCLRLALARSPETRAAAADETAAEARVRGARAAYWPQLLGQAQYGHAEGYDVAVTNGGVTQFGLAVDVPIWDGGLRAAGLAAAQERLRSAAALTEQHRADVAFAVRTAYWAALAARREAEIESDAVRALGDYLALQQRQAQLGLAPAGDVPRVELALANARSAARSAVAALDAATRELSERIGSPLDGAALLAQASLLPLPHTDDGLDGSPPIADARAAAAAAQHETDAVRSERRGRFGLAADGGFLGVNPGPTFRDNGGGEFLFSFSIPLFDGGAIAARVAAAAATAASADANVELVRQTIAIALGRLQTETRRAQADLDAWRGVQPAATEALLLMRARYVGGGDVRLLDVLDVLTQSVDARLALVHAELALQTATAAQYQVLGKVEP
ncbi:MAG: TolC family protein [bacterium]